MGFGPPGFLNAPASKLVTCGCAAATLAAHLLGVAAVSYTHLTLPTIYSV